MCTEDRELSTVCFLPSQPSSEYRPDPIGFQGMWYIESRIQAHVGRERRPWDPSEFSRTNIPLCRSDIPSSTSRMTVGERERATQFILTNIVKSHPHIYKCFVSFILHFARCVILLEIICSVWGRIQRYHKLYTISAGENTHGMWMQQYQTIISTWCIFFVSVSIAEWFACWWEAIILSAYRFTENRWIFQLESQNVNSLWSKVKLEICYHIVLSSNSTFLIYGNSAFFKWRQWNYSTPCFCI